MVILPATVAGPLPAGAVVGATVANAEKPVSTTYVYPSSGVYVAPSTTIVTSTPAAPYLGLPIGTRETVLPTGFTAVNTGGVQYYLCNNTWYRPYFGSSGPYYLVVPAP